MFRAGVSAKLRMEDLPLIASSKSQFCSLGSKKSATLTLLCRAGYMLGFATHF